MIYSEDGDLQIRDAELRGRGDIERFCDDIDKFMGEFKDPREETLEAVKKAMGDGVVLEAMKEDRRVGIMVLNKTAFEEFQPSYHLAYIAVDSNELRKGYGKTLFEVLEEISGGDFSLHVEEDNIKARKFYKRMGLETKYLRMMP